MPDIKVFVPAVIGIAALVLIAGSIGWLLDHPTVLIGAALVIGGGLFLIARRTARRNRV